MGTGMEASSPSTIFSNATLSPALSSNTMLTASTYSSETSTKGLLGTSEYATASTVSSESTFSSTASTLYHPSDNDMTHSRPNGVREYFSWLRDSVNTNASGVFGSIRGNFDAKDHIDSKLLESFIEPPHRPTLKELSKRDTRYYGKNSGPPSTAVSGVAGGRLGRKGPKKPDAKAFFSNERTFMHWIKFGLLLGSMALTLVSFGKSVGLQVGLFLILVSMATLVYATIIYHLRHRWMEQIRHDVRFYDRIGPTILFVALFIGYAVNVALTMDKLVGELRDDEGYNFYNPGDEPMAV
ncbi:hypothetical protein BGZ50_006664 [Haplosporangium sp. Z 11]|nr:hypothetical protein BGZ50_006664 [Haplosporangium sp. Z 11]